MSSQQEAIGKQITFAQLFEEFGRVQIPIIQRDYAQGRKGQQDLRDDFLSALKEALSREGSEIAPLDLDFVYGSGFTSEENGEEKESFAPLDGQQRLTTLFLLHWYLAWKDEDTSDFAERFFENEKSLFAYEVRPSSHDFFNRLAQYYPQSSPAQIESVAAWVKDAAWFFRSWEYDPSIVSALTILDSIHEQFSECSGYYRRLIDAEQPRITFQLLELRNFGLSDDLYIKMNARGKPLTPFENFKARLEQHLDELLANDVFVLHSRQVGVREYFSHQMDTEWADLFWDHRNTTTNLFDDRVMRLIHTVALVSIDTEKDNAQSTAAAIRGMKPEASFSRYSDYGCLSEDTLRTLIALLDFWSEQEFEEGSDKDSEDNIYDTAKAFVSATSENISYPELVRFGAFAKFITAKGAGEGTSLFQWMRVIHNLVENADVERPSQLVSALGAIDQMLDSADTILRYLVDGGDVKFFYSWQIEEERIKAALILKGDEWTRSILQAERHKYFNGQIEFLLDFSGILDWWDEKESLEWNSSEETGFFERFNDYLEKAEAIFSPRGLKIFGDCLWERALLCEGDYTLQQGKNRTFLQNASTSGSSKRHSWKTILRGRVGYQLISDKRKLVQRLLDALDLDKGIETCLEKVISSCSVDEAWRRMLIETPDAISYCGQKMFRRIDGGAVYLISKQRTSSEHMELWSYYLYKMVIEKMDEAGELMPFRADYSKASGEDYRPSARIHWNRQNFLLEIDYVSNSYRFALQKGDDEARGKVHAYLESEYKSEEQDKWDLFEVPESEAEVVIKAIVSIGKTLDQNEDVEDE